MAENQQKGEVCSIRELPGDLQKTVPRITDEVNNGGKIWAATPENGYLFGDLYRVGAQMLMDIKRDKGINAFYEVLGDSGRLFQLWTKCGKRN